MAPGARTTDQIMAGEAPFDVSERRKDDGNNGRVIATTWHVPRAGREPLQKIFTLGCRSSQKKDTTQTLWADGRHSGTKSVGYPVID